MQRPEIRTFGSRFSALVSLLLFSALSLSADYHPIEVTHGGIIRGVVKFPGETPARGMFATHGDPHCPAGIPQEHLIVRQENRGIKNALVVLDIQRGKRLPVSQALLDNKACRFVPRVQWVPKSASLFLSNSDPTLHNVHALRRDMTAFSVDIPAGGPPVRRPLVDTGLYKINCDRHLWMRAWVLVSEHPYVAVTDDHGRFEIRDVPPGSYTIRAWHEGWVEKGTEKTGQLLYQPMQEELQTRVRENQPAEVVFDDMQPAFL